MRLQESTSVGRRAGINSVLVLDDQDSFSTSLGRDFRKLGYAVWLSANIDEARAVCETACPDFLVTELRLGGRWAYDFMREFREGKLVGAAIIATAYPSVATAVRALREGFAAYFAKPVNAHEILDAIVAEKPALPPVDIDSAPAWPSLDLTIWEYINQVYVAAGTMSEAARRLGLDRRSLRRMLAKYPPSR